MITLRIPFEGFQSTVKVPLEDIEHYCGPSYHIGWLAGMGYVATSVEGHICRRGEGTPLASSASVAEDDSYEFVYDLARCERIDLSIINANCRPSNASSSTDTDTDLEDTADVSKRDPFCVFSGIDLRKGMQTARIFPAYVDPERFDLVKQRVGLRDIGELANLLRVTTLGRDGLNKHRRAALFATDDRFVPLQHMQSLQAADRGPFAAARQTLSPDIPLALPRTAVEQYFRIYFHFAVTRDKAGARKENGLQYLLDGSPVYVPHQCVARFTATAFDSDSGNLDDAPTPAREAVHYMYWGAMLLHYLDSESVAALQPSDMGDPAASGPARTRRRRAGKDKAPSKGEDIFDLVSAMNRHALAPALKAQAAREKDENVRAVRTWQAGVQ